NHGTIADAYAAVDVGSTYYAGYVGGLVGLNYHEITNAYATGDVEGDGGPIGGLVGANNSYSLIIKNTYATGQVTGGKSTRVGGLVGRNSNTKIGAITASYWATDTSGQAKGCGNDTTCGGGAAGKTTAELMR